MRLEQDVHQGRDDDPALGQQVAAAPRRRKQVLATLAAVAAILGLGLVGKLIAERPWHGPDDIARSDFQAWLAADWDSVESHRDVRARWQLSATWRGTAYSRGGPVQDYFATLSVFDPSIRSIDCHTLAGLQPARTALLGRSNWHEDLDLEGLECHVAVGSRLHDRLGVVALWQVTQLLEEDGKILATSFDNSSPDARATNETGAFEVLGALHRFAAGRPGHASACTWSAAGGGAACGDFLAAHVEEFVAAYEPFSADGLRAELATGAAPEVVVEALHAMADETADATAVAAPGSPFTFTADGWNGRWSEYLARSPSVDACHVEPGVMWLSAMPMVAPFWQGESVGFVCRLTIPGDGVPVEAVITDGLITQLTIGRWESWSLP